MYLPTHKTATLCYVLWTNEEEGKDELLLLYRNKKENDFHEGKFVPVGGRLNPGETPLECVIREVKEEAGYQLTPSDVTFRGYIYFDEINRDLVKNEDIPGFNIIVFVYTAHVKSKIVVNNPEGELKWFQLDKIPYGRMWGGDKIFAPKILETEEIIEAKFLYEGQKVIKWDFGQL